MTLEVTLRFMGGLFSSHYSPFRILLEPLYMQKPLAANMTAHLCI